ncbi:MULTISPECIES: RsmB/NOP family class I SAM-dependent RNA methyltransferase [Acidianus]|uniref:Fmu (Sun) domain-containing protein n=1 Tax=Candidatus Acidianus copahuensis TaxID=1160895 RepID=A0A031LP82_9CREN|nr:MULTISPECIES: RsmB/NOP family class I SAM-dependent RNA methyltransferase [Acidianus]EZQ06575.1 Fmu (Sun) domain-containing protein [Candidatus Acidianus copahuensis]NON63006.1 RsmB/NOP family class I SAM-dependent RNA methyltransferase [Acidianus sp. RZ1]
MECKKLIVEGIHLSLKGYSPEKSFDSAFKLYPCGNRREQYEEFLAYLKKYICLKGIYPGYEISEVLEKADDNCYLSFSLPNWIYSRLFALLGKEGIKGLFKRKRWIRINTLKVDINSVKTSLLTQGISLLPTEFSFLFEVDKRVSYTDQFKGGLVIPQDKSSVIAVSFLDPREGERILEIGSAPGVKTSLIQQITRNRSYVIAIDISEKRIRTQKELMILWGVENVDLIVADGLHLPIRKVDKVFIDAPCSNSGTLNVDPSVLLRIEKKDILRLFSIQKAILRETQRLKTKVVYTTCSLFPEEGEKVVEEFEDYLVPIKNCGHEGYRKSRVWLRVFRTYPHIDESEGFFIAKLDFSSIPQA